ncbi:MAG TPA: FKBP-type peptidyl-prolyl cis-trans isomerase [Vicinamibacterales bacterium]|nr:FKBP-type peptidyl-prolyl cis-trans isomerase [Vicinamibacterales bacterium]
MTFRRITFRLAGVVLAALAAGCGESPTTPSTAPYKQTDVRVGSGTEATAGAVVTVNYTGWLYDAARLDGKGIQFDTSIGADPFAFTLGFGQVIQGWDQGVAGMKVGGLRRLVVPPSLAYGPVRYGPIPPDATLVFDIELVDVQTSATQ